MTWVKICGITNIDDAKNAAYYGADALGFIFTESKRQIEPEKAKEIINSLPKEVEKIGVFLNEKPEKIRKIASSCGLTGLQFHGDETPEYCKFFNDFWVIKAFRVSVETKWDDILPYVDSEAVHRILLDAYVPGSPGGTGKAFPWEFAASRKSFNMPLIVAGGISCENVVSAIQETGASGIDVCSGIEKVPGRKDVAKLKKLIFKVKKHNNF